MRCPAMLAQRDTPAWLQSKHMEPQYQLQQMGLKPTPDPPPGSTCCGAHRSQWRHWMSRSSSTYFSRQKGQTTRLAQGAQCV